MAKQLFLNNFETVFVSYVKDAPVTGTPATELDYGVLRVSDGAAGVLLNPSNGDYYVLTAYKRSGSVESDIEVMRVTSVNNATPGECRISVERAQEGTTALGYVAGDHLALRWTRGGAENVVQYSDSRLTNSRAPTGTAGGVLSGTYPNPGFAEDMATQAEVNGALALKAPLASPTFTGTVGGITKAMVGLGNVDNTSDADKPVSTAQATAISASTATNIHAATDKATPVDADELGLSDSAASWGLKKLTFANLKAWLSGLYVGKTGAQVIAGDLTAPSLNGGQLAGLRNKIINGGFDVWQRGISFASAGAYPYTADRWAFYRNGLAAGATVSQRAGVRWKYCLRVQRDAGNAGLDGIVLGQIIEGINCYPLAGNTCTLRVRLRVGANFSGTGITLAVSTGTVEDQGNITNPAGWTGYAVPMSTNILPTTSFADYTVTGVIAAGVKEIRVSIAYTPTGTAGTFDHFEVEEVQLEVGSVATPFEHRPYGMELALCQRYLQVLADGASNQAVANGVAISTTAGQLQRFLYGVMRTSPTLSVSSAADFIAITSTGTSAGAPTSITGAVLTPTYVRIDFSGTPANLAAGNAVSLQSSSANARVYLSAEL